MWTPTKKPIASGATDARFRWTAHAKRKMRFYGLSEARVRRVIHSPHRIEEGMAPETAACMQRAGTARKPSEIWVMIQAGRSKPPARSPRVVISAWRYPGATKPRAQLPDRISAEIEEALRS